MIDAEGNEIKKEYVYEPEFHVLKPVVFPSKTLSSSVENKINIKTSDTTENFVIDGSESEYSFYQIGSNTVNKINIYSKVGTDLSKRKVTAIVTPCVIAVVVMIIFIIVYNYLRKKALKLIRNNNNNNQENSLEVSLINQQATTNSPNPYYKNNSSEAPVYQIPKENDNFENPYA